MKHIDFYLDFISPYAYLAFEQLPKALEGLSYEVAYKPVLFAALLKHHGQLGPAEIPGKREWTYRQALWHAQTAGLPMQMPSAHPFNPLGLLRLATACGPNRFVCETLFRHAWRGGADAADAGRLQVVQQQLAPQRDPNSQEVKDALKAATEEAIAAGLFGVPTMAVDGKLFWGYDALPMLREYLEGHEWFGTSWDEPVQLPAAVARVRA